MAHLNLATQCEIVKADTATAAGTDDTITSDAVEVDGAESVLCLVCVGTVTATGTIAIQVTGCDTSGGSYTNITGATAAGTDADDDVVFAIEVVRPKLKYLKIAVTRATANVVIDTMVCVIQKNKNAPITQGATVGDTPSVVVA